MYFLQKCIASKISEKDINIRIHLELKKCFRFHQKMSTLQCKELFVVRIQHCFLG